MMVIIVTTVITTATIEGARPGPHGAGYTDGNSTSAPDHKNRGRQTTRIEGARPQEYRAPDRELMMMMMMMMVR
jgi:hypothetical protein